MREELAGLTDLDSEHMRAVGGFAVPAAVGQLLGEQPVDDAPERIGEGSGLPAAIRPVEDLLSVVLALEPGDSAVALRALKDHDSPDLSALHVALDPRTLLLKRS